jgi:hypothetical protein
VLSLLAYRGKPVEVVGRDDPTPWSVLELEYSPRTSDAVTVVKHRGTRALNVSEIAVWFRAEHDSFVILPLITGVNQTTNYIVARSPTG